MIIGLADLFTKNYDENKCIVINYSYNIITIKNNL